MPNRRYCAFISYRHTDNSKEGRRWAEWLHRAIERYVVPPDLSGTLNQRGEPIPATLYPIFRDEDELPANADLAAGIGAALEISDHLIVLCSPRSAVSPWVRKEVREFKELGRAARILAVIIAGEPNAADPIKSREGILPEEECFCEELRFGAVQSGGVLDWSIRTEPLAADLRPSGIRAEGFVSADAYREHLTLTSAIAPEKIAVLAEAYHARLELGLLKIVAGLLGVPVGQLTERDAAYRAALAENEARRQREIAERERTSAERERRAADEARRANERARQANVRLQWRNRILACLTVVALALAALAAWAWAQAQAKQTIADAARAKALSLNEEAARSDRYIAEDFLESGKAPEALAHLARAITYQPESTMAAEKAVAAWNDWHFPPPLTLCLGHEDAVISAQFSPDGLKVVTTSDDSTARIWEPASGKLLSTLSGHSRPVVDAQFSPDGRLILTASHDGTARIWNFSSGKEILKLSRESDWRAMLCARFSPDGQRVVGAWGDGEVRVWDAASGKLVSTLTGHTSYVVDAHFSPNGGRIVTASSDDTARVWDVESGKTVSTLIGHRLGVTSAAFSHDGNRIVTASWDGTARVWDVESGKQLTILIGHKGFVESAQFSPDGKWIVTASNDQTARVWEAESGTLVTTLVGHKDDVISAEFNPDGERVLTASKDKTVRVWASRNGTLISTLTGHLSSVSCAHFSLDGKRIVTAADDGVARIWNAEEHRLVIKLYGIGWRAASPLTSEDGKLIAFSSEGNTAQVREVKGDRLVATLIDHKDSVTGLFFSQDSQRIISISRDKTAKVWEAVSGKLLLTLPVDTQEARDRTVSWKTKDGTVLLEVSVPGREWIKAGFSFDGKRVFTLSGSRLISTFENSTSYSINYDGNSARAWDATNGKLLATFSQSGHGIVNASLSPDGRHIALILNDDTVSIWEVENCALISQLAGHSLGVISAQFSTDGKRIVTTSQDKTARIWAVQSGRLEATLTGHRGSVLSARFSPDSQRLITYSQDETARLWDSSTGEMLATRKEIAEIAWTSVPEGRPIWLGDTPYPWNLLPPNAGPPPEWFRDLLLYIGQRRLNADGSLEVISPHDWLMLQVKLRAALRREAENTTPYMDVLRQLVRE